MSAEKLEVSVVVPALNEAANVRELVLRVARELRGKVSAYEIIIIDDFSTDRTGGVAQRLFRKYKLPVRVFSKVGKQGKGYSLLQGFAKARYEIVAFIDADLQYPPEALGRMLRLIASGRADVVVANRNEVGAGVIRRATSQTFRWLFGRVLWGFKVDVQSGLKMFRKDILRRVQPRPQAWSFDLEFLAWARSGGYQIGQIDIDFAKRRAGSSKVKVFSTALQLAWAAIKLRFNPPVHVPFHDGLHQTDGYGFHYKGEKYSTHTLLHPRHLAVNRVTKMQVAQMTLLAVGSLAAIILNWHAYAVVIVSGLTIMYFCSLLLDIYLIKCGFYQQVELSASAEELAAPREWPRYTVFCPLYKEAQVVPQFIEAMRQLDYPATQLEVLLLLEEDDAETISHIRAMRLPKNFSVVVVPHAMPKTKPKACNYGLQIATGEYAVIFDAEDIPEPDQLKKAVIAFSKVGPEVACIQAKLNYYNWNQNLLTRLFTLEYSLWFDLVLPGLQSVRAPIPLGGTSNHFRTQDLRDLGGWDPFNVTEDADLGMRIAKQKRVTAMLDSTTFEEANSQFTNWLKQRSRWIKGYMQTYFVHTRRAMAFVRDGQAHNELMFRLVIGGKALSMLANPLLWLLTLLYFVFRGQVGELIHSLYPAPIFYIGVFSLIVGNFLYMYYYIMGAAKRGQYELILYSALVPFYWLMMSVAAIYALRDLVVRPHHWHKTKHGLHLAAQPAHAPEPTGETA